MSDRTAKGLTRSILNALTLEIIDIKKMSGQVYDGCNTMSEAFKGVREWIKAEVPEALFVHCASHCSNLAVVHSAEISYGNQLRNTVGTVGIVCSFFSNSAPRTLKSRV